MARLTKQQIADNEAAEAALREEQQAELARLRKERRDKARAAKLVVESNQVEQTVFNEARPFDAAAEDADRYAKINAAWATLMEGFEVPSWKRTLAGVVLAMAAAFGTGYLIGSVAGMLIVGAVALTGMAWLGWVIMALGIVLGAWCGGRVASAVFGYIADKKIDLHFDGVKSSMSSWFRKPVITEFSGAHEASV